MILAAEGRHIHAMTDLFNRAAGEDVLYKAIDENRAAEFFLQNSETVDKFALVWQEEEERGGLHQLCVCSARIPE